MKVKKTSVCIFILAFVVGVISFIFIHNPERKPIQAYLSEIVKENLPVVPQQPSIEKKIEPEFIEENNDWQNEDDSKFKVKLLEPGQGFHGDEINAKSGEVWLGLFEEKGKYFLEPIELKIRRVHDPVIDGYYEKDATQKTGKSVFVNKKSEPIFFVKNARMLNQGYIETLYRYDDESESSDGEDTSIRNGFAKEFKLGEVTFTIKAKKGKNKKQENILSLVIESEGISQTIHTIKYFEEGDYLGSLGWAGDLDRDGKPDFYFSLYVNYNVEYRNLFLSSQAKKGKLVKKVATFTTTGC